MMCLKCRMSSRAESEPFWAPAWWMWAPRISFAAWSRTWVAVWWRMRDQRRSSSTIPLTRSPRLSAPPATRWRITSPRLDHVLDPDHRIGREEGARVRGLTAALGVEEGLVQDHEPVEEVDDDRLELDLARLLVVERAGRRQGRDTLLVGRERVVDALALALGVHVRDERVEVVGDLDDGALGSGHLLDQLGRETVRVVEGDDLGERHLLALLLVRRGDLLDDPGPALDGRAVLLGLALEDLADHLGRLLELLLADLLDLLYHEVGEREVEVELVHDPEGPAKDEPGQVALADVRRDDAVAEHVREAPGVVRDGVDLLNRRDHLGQPVNRDVDGGRDLLPEGEEVRSRDVHEPGELRVEREDLGVVLVLEVVVQPGLGEEGRNEVREDRVVDRGRARRGPGQALEPVPGVDDPVRHGPEGLPLELDRGLVRPLLAQRHEDQCRDLEPADQDLDGRAGVPAADPRVLLVGHRGQVPADRGEELVAELDGPVLPVDLGRGVVEGVVGHHLEERQVTPRAADRVQVVEAYAGLRDGERVGRRRGHPARHERLEVRNRGDGEVDVVPPAGRDGVPVDPGVVVPLEEREVGLAHLVEGVGREDGVPDERVRLAGSVSADLPFRVAGPERGAAARADPPFEPLVAEVLELIVLFAHVKSGPLPCSIGRVPAPRRRMNSVGRTR